MATIIAKVAGIIGKNVLTASLWSREPTPEPTPFQKSPGFPQKAPGFSQKAAAFARNPPPFTMKSTLFLILLFLQQYSLYERGHIIIIYVTVAVHIGILKM